MHYSRNLLRVSEEKAGKLSRRLDIIMACAAIAGISSLLAQHGFYISDETARILRYLDFFVLGIFVVHRLSKAFLSDRPLRYIRSRLVDFVLVGLILISFPIVANLLTASWANNLAEQYSIHDVTRIYVAMAQFYILLSLALEAIRYSKFAAAIHIQPSLILLLSFMAVILAGSLLLLLPRATVKPIPFTDALFTAASATCVTGLTVVDTATRFTPLGQVIILGLIQVGGIGIMVFTTFFALFLGGLGMKEQLLMRDFLSEESIGSIGRTLRQILMITFITEAIGAAALYLSSQPSGAITGFQRLFYAVFHSISAFCNAGFSLFSDNLMDPATSGPAALISIACLIILGGLGAAVLMNIIRVLHSRLHRHPGLRDRLTIQSKLVLSTTAGLIIFGMGSFLLFEWHHLVVDLPLNQKLLHGFFQSVSARTAGFNTVQIGGFLASTSLVFMVLMFIGASPGSAGGGIKTTTFAVGLLTIYSVSMGKMKVEIFRRQISENSILRAYVTIMLSIAVVAGSVFLLSFTEQAPLIDVAFEVISAFSTTGLSRGITPHLSEAGKLIITICMFVGRIGPLTAAFALSPRRYIGPYDYPQENVATV